MRWLDGNGMEKEWDGEVDIFIVRICIEYLKILHYIHLHTACLYRVM